MTTPQNKKEKEICWKKCPNAIATPHVHDENPAPQEKDWQKEFKTGKFSEILFDGSPMRFASDELVEFIRQLIQQAEERGREDHNEDCAREEWIKMKLAQSQKELLGKIEKMIEGWELDYAADGKEIEEVAKKFGVPVSVAALRIFETQKDALLTELKTLE